ncbi:hypothetical protein C2857_001967 [Epichloe festucae Fl1]|uniref:Uncharacterized protein n=1 Tax=Epichloe festucae (strain Fl1) TaxID=877507 RepID=A0A7U3Q182_EPIFF|nr:hypothetical protein C2857_001967 [Epichloe festucae Fl1]
MMVVQTAKLATTATPIPIRHHSTTFFELPHKKRRQRRLIEEEQRQRALLEAAEESRTRAWNYVVEFLQASEWRHQMGQITVVYDAVPTMEELESYGDLDEKEGTRTCRKLFKAPVVWDELGHGLWKVLSAAAEKKLPTVVEEPAKPAAPVCWNNSFAACADVVSHSSVGSPRRSSSRRSSADSCSTAVSQDSVSPRMSLSSSPGRHGSIPRILSRITARRSNT